MMGVIEATDSEKNNYNTKIYYLLTSSFHDQSIHQGRGNDRTDEVIKLFVIWPLSLWTRAWDQPVSR